MDPHSSAPKKNTNHGNEVLLQDTTHFVQRPCYQQGSPCKEPTGNRTTRRPLDDRKETEAAVVWTCLPFIRSGHNHFARPSERGRKTRLKEEEVAEQHQGMDRPGVRQVQEGSCEQIKWRKLVVNSSLVPKRPSPLRDRWWWWWLYTQFSLCAVRLTGPKNQLTKQLNRWVVWYGKRSKYHRMDRAFTLACLAMLPKYTNLGPKSYVGEILSLLATG